MSHFTVLCLIKEGQTLGELLEPYDEKMECEPRICKTREEFINSTRKYYKDEPEIFELSDDDFIEEMRNHDYSLDKDGNEFTAYNEKSQWDWFVVGGRWPDMLRLTPEAYTLYLEENAARLSGGRRDSLVMSASGTKPGRCNAARIKHLDFSPDKKVYDSRLKFWDMYVTGELKPETEDEEEEVKWAHYKPEYYIERFGTRENFADLESRFGTWAVLTPDGIWHQKGNMGWWACSDETHDEATAWATKYKEAFIDTADPEWVAVLVDCHI